MFVKNKIGPPGCNVLNDEDRMPVLKVISGDTWVVDSELIAADGGPASPANSCVEFVLSENQFSPPIWTGVWANGIVPDENRPGLVHVRIPREVTKALRRGSYMFSMRVSDKMKYFFDTQLVGNFLVEYMPTSDQHSIPYRDGTSEIFGGSSRPCSSNEIIPSDNDEIENLKKQVQAIASAIEYMRKSKANKDEMSVVAGTGSESDRATIKLKDGTSIDVLISHQDVSGKANKDEMSVTAGTGDDSGTATIQLKDGLSVKVLTEHQDISGKADNEEVARPYRYVVPEYASGTVMLVPFANNVLDMSSEAMSGVSSFTVSVDQVSHQNSEDAPMRDIWFCVRSSGEAPEITWPEGSVPANKDETNFLAVDQSTTVFLLSEYEEGHFIVARQVVSVAAEEAK